MRIVFLGNNWVGLQVLRWLKSRGEEVVGLVAHPAAKQKCGPEIIAAAGLEPEAVFFGPQLRDPVCLERIKALRPDAGVSAYFGYILKPEFLELFPRGVVNLHPALLPFNRGHYPNVWSILEGTPAGATLHCVDAGVDTGDILAQRELAVEPVDTGKTLYHKLEQLCLELFQEAWPDYKAGKLARRPQPANAGTEHRSRDIEEIDAIDLDRAYPARRLINLLRARTFPPYRGAYFVENGRKVYLKLDLAYEDANA